MLATLAAQRTSTKTLQARCIECNIHIRRARGRRKVIKTLADCEKFANLLRKCVNIGDMVCRKCHLRAINRKIRRNEIPVEDPLKIEVATSLIESTSAGPMFTEELEASTMWVATATDTVGETFYLSPPRMSSFESHEMASTSFDPIFILSTSIPEYDQEVLEMPFNSVVSSPTFCFVCGSTDGIISVPVRTRRHIFLARRLYVPKENQCCCTHLLGNRLYEEDVDNLRTHSPSSLIKTGELREYFEYLTVDTSTNITDKVGDFTLSEETLKVLTGLSWENLIELREMLISMRNSQACDITQAIVVFLFKLRTGSSNSVIAAILGYEHESQISDFCQSVLNSFETDILPFHFGFNAVTRKHLLVNETSPIAKELLNITDQVAFIFDGTYICYENGSDNTYQRKSYSGQKQLPLCKPFTVCTTNGYILDMLGPFYTAQNDAKILRNIMETSDGLKSIIKPGDICIIDHSLRDVQSFLEELGYIVLIPNLKKNRAQMATKDANISRQIAQVRWVVEAVHGTLRHKYKLLHHELNNNLPETQTYCQIAAFLQNKFGDRFNLDTELSAEIITKMQSSLTEQNSLIIRIKSKHWNRGKHSFNEISPHDLLDFPQLTDKDLELLFTGRFQLSQAVAYLAEMMTEENNINFQYFKGKSDIAGFKIRSRHMYSKAYCCYVDYIPDSNGHAGIKRYWCECPSGNQTVGCCSHLAVIIYYLSRGRYLSRVLKPAVELSRMFNENGVMAVINEDSDED